MLSIAGIVCAFAAGVAFLVVALRYAYQVVLGGELLTPLKTGNTSTKKPRT